MNSRFAVAALVMAYLTFREGESVSSAEIADNVGTNPVVIRRILGTLQKSALVHTTRGVQGGTRLAKKASHISLADIYEAVEHEDNDLFLVRALAKQGCSEVSLNIQRSLGDLFRDAEQVLKTSLAEVSIEHVFRRARAQATCTPGPEQP